MIRGLIIFVKASFCCCIPDPYSTQARNHPKSTVRIRLGLGPVNESLDGSTFDRYTSAKVSGKR